MECIEIMTQKMVRPDEQEGRVGGENQSQKTGRAGDLIKTVCTHRLSTLASPKHRTQTCHFLQTRTSWSLLFQKGIGQAIISTHDQLQPRQNRREGGDKAGGRFWRGGKGSTA